MMWPVSDLALKKADISWEANDDEGGVIMP